MLLTYKTTLGQKCAFDQLLGQLLGDGRATQALPFHVVATSCSVSSVQRVPASTTPAWQMRGVWMPCTDVSVPRRPE